MSKQYAGYEIEALILLDREFFFDVDSRLREHLMSLGLITKTYKLTQHGYEVLKQFYSAKIHFPQTTEDDTLLYQFFAQYVPVEGWQDVLQALQDVFKVKLNFKSSVQIVANHWQDRPSFMVREYTKHNAQAWINELPNLSDDTATNTVTLARYKFYTQNGAFFYIYAGVSSSGKVYLAP